MYLQQVLFVLCVGLPDRGSVCRMLSWLGADDENRLWILFEIRLRSSISIVNGMKFENFQSLKRCTNLILSFR